MAPDLINKLAEHGILGLLLAVSLYVIYRQNVELTLERAARLKDSTDHRGEIKAQADQRLADAQAYAEKVLELNTAVHGTVDKLTDVADRFVQLPADRRRSHA